MSVEPAKRRLCWIGLVAVALVLFLTAIFAAPFLLTKQLLHLALGRVFPNNSLKVGDAALSLSGTLVLRDVALRDTGTQLPLVSVSEVDAAFHWKELLSRQIRKIEAKGLTVYARADSGSQLGLLGLFYKSSPSARSNLKPLWIDKLNVQGTIQSEASTGIARSNAEWPLTLEMTMSGDDRMAPSRHFSMAVGNALQLSEKVPTQPTVAAFGLQAEVETQPAAGGTRVVVRRLVARHAALAIEADTLRPYVPGLPRELHGPIETGFGNLSASGELNLRELEKERRLAGRLSFAGLRVHTPSNSPIALNLQDMAGVLEINTSPLKPSTTIKMERLSARNAGASIPAAVLRRYAQRLPPDLHGPIDAKIGAFDLSGLIGSEPGQAIGFSGKIRVQALSVRVPNEGKPAFALEGLTAAGTVESPIDRWAPAALKVHDGVMQCASLTYGANAVYKLDASWRIEDDLLKADRFNAQIFDGTISGSPAVNLVTHEMPPSDFQIKSINAHQALANISPQHLDAEGNATGSVHMMLSKDSEQLKVKFIRQPRTASDSTTPHKEVINGKEVVVGSLVVPTIDMTIPITGKSLGEILSMASGISPLIAGLSTQPGK